MAYLYSFIIGGLLCVLGQLIIEIKVPKPVVLCGFIILGGVLTPFGIFDKLASWGAGSMNIMACGLGNAGIGTAVQACMGIIAPLLMVLCLLIILIGLGSLSGNLYFKKYADKLPPLPDVPQKDAQA